MKVTAATLLTLLAAAPSAYAANTRRLGAADVSDIDNRRLSMDLIETAAVEPADYYYYEGGESKSGKSKGTDKSKGTNKSKGTDKSKGSAKSDKGDYYYYEGSAKSDKSKGTDKSKGSAKSDKGDYYYYEGGESKNDKSKGSAKSDKSKGSAKSGKEASAKSDKGSSSSMMAATGPPPEAAALIAKIIEVLGELGVDMPEQASGVEPAVFNGPIIDAIIESILEALFGYGGSKSGKGSKSGDHDYYYYEGDSKSGKGESKSAKGESKSSKSGGGLVCISPDTPVGNGEACCDDADCVNSSDTCTVIGTKYCATNDQFANNQVDCSAGNTCTDSCIVAEESCGFGFELSKCTIETQGIGGICGNAGR